MHELGMAIELVNIFLDISKIKSPQQFNILRNPCCLSCCGKTTIMEFLTINFLNLSIDQAFDFLLFNHLNF